ncbi:uncharacterized protein LOC143182668 [Calliopsis andreniformis]|uniref:uncharacterized protein LOC143182668 n=1 Tax=Calliopsis andreniformis TaxID=337506 RepID=UPI003FCCA5C2
MASSGSSSADKSSDSVPPISEVNRVGIRVPPFWPEQPTVWFNQIEAQFVLNGVTADTTKFYYVMSQLEPRYALEVQDIFSSPPETNKYETLKHELIHRLSASQSQRIRQLLEQEEIGDRTPSQFLRHMKSLAGTTVSEDFLRTLWSSRLPEMTRAIVTAQPDLPLNKLAEIADQIQQNSARTQVATVSSNDMTEVLLKRLESLELRIAEMTRSRSRGRYGGRQKSRSRGRSNGRNKSPARKDHCWYHQVFGTKSTKCRSPCSWGQETGNDKDRH